MGIIQSIQSIFKNFPGASSQPEVDPSGENLQVYRNPSKNKLILGTGLILVQTVILVVLYVFKLPPFTNLSQPKSISKSVPVTKTLVRGNLTAIEGTNITLSSYGKPRTFSLAQTKNFKQVTGGTIEKGDAKTGPSSMASLKPGQEILVVADLGSAEAKDIYILH